jgi:hypothetical protein
MIEPEEIATLVVMLASGKVRSVTGAELTIDAELAIWGIKVAPSTVWEMLKTHGIPPAPDRDHLIWATFLRSQAHAPTLTGARLFILAVVEHATRYIRIRGATHTPPQPGPPRWPGTWSWTCRSPRRRDLPDRDQDSRHTAAVDAVLADSGITTINTAPCVPQLPCACSPNRSPKPTNWTSSPSNGEIDSAASFTSTTMPLNSTDEIFGTHRS